MLNYTRKTKTKIDNGRKIGGEENHKYGTIDGGQLKVLSRRIEFNGREKTICSTQRPICVFYWALSAVKTH
jgi:hypothetical protein